MLQRENAVDSFRAGKTWVLIATDLMGRGMDFKGVNHVINYDFPPTIASYIHRIGEDESSSRTRRQQKLIKTLNGVLYRGAVGGLSGDASAWQFIWRKGRQRFSVLLVVGSRGVCAVGPLIIAAVECSRFFFRRKACSVSDHKPLLDFSSLPLLFHHPKPVSGFSRCSRNFRGFCMLLLDSVSSC